MHSNGLWVILVVILAVALLPTWPYSNSWGPYPSGIVGLILVVLLLMIFLGRI